MKCTNKEQETCEVEKRGCKGCYYNDGNDTNVGSIEDIKILERFLKEMDDIFQKTKINNTKERKALQNLLKNYERQKQINEEHQKINGELREKVKELEKENKLILNSKIGIDLSYNNYVQKQTIKDKL